ncbi:MAG: type II toxin-antitoxin system VapC family toxin [Candidatus Aminicenantes bacterium]|nr:type II toxin-antitoxin system VapC family toxin [Candidatus Aminicenantes bacterium]
MEADLILVDTNIIIEVLRNNKEIISVIKSIGVERLAVSCITVMELYYGALNKADLRKIKRYIEAFELIQISQEISQLAIDLIEKYSKSHNLNLPDALIASTAITCDMELYTLNLKDFRYINGMRLWAFPR